MVLTEENLMDYMKCPVKYELSKNVKTTDNETYNSLIHKTYNSYINKITNMNIKDDSSLMKRKWDNTCQKNPQIITSKKVISGWGLLYAAYEYIKYNEIKFTDTSMAYRIEIEGSGATLVGNLDPFIDHGETVEFIIPSFSNTMPDRGFIDMKLKHTIDAYAIKKMIGKDSVFKYHSFKFNQDIYTFRKQQSFDRLETIIKNVTKSISQNLIYPRETFACSTCLCKGICKAWTGK